MIPSSTIARKVGFAVHRPGLRERCGEHVGMWHVACVGGWTPSRAGDGPRRPEAPCGEVAPAMVLRNSPKCRRRSTQQGLSQNLSWCLQTPPESSGYRHPTSEAASGCSVPHAFTTFRSVRGHTALSCIAHQPLQQRDPIAANVFRLKVACVNSREVTSNGTFHPGTLN